MFLLWLNCILRGRGCCRRDWNLNVRLLINGSWLNLDGGSIRERIWCCVYNRDWCTFNFLGRLSLDLWALAHNFLLNLSRLQLWLIFSLLNRLFRSRTLHIIVTVFVLNLAKLDGGPELSNLKHELLCVDVWVVKLPAKINESGWKRTQTPCCNFFAFSLTGSVRELCDWKSSFFVVRNCSNYAVVRIVGVDFHLNDGVDL